MLSGKIYVNKPHNTKHLVPKGRREGQDVLPSFLLIAHKSFFFPAENTACADFPHRCVSSAVKASAEQLIIPDTADYDTIVMVSAPALSSESNSRCHLHPRG